MRGEPEHGLGAESAHHSAFLRYYRATVAQRVRSLPAAERVRSRVPSGWSPLELLHHVVHVERRWLVWGFLGEPVDEPWGDSLGDPDGAWRLPERAGLDEVLVLMEGVAARTDEILRTTPLDSPAALGGRFEADPPDLRWICFHVLQEYARHAGHLDVAVELAGGDVGE